MFLRRAVKKYKGELCLLGVSLLWGFGYAVIEYALKEGVSPLKIQTLRFLIGSLCLLPLVLRDLSGMKKSTLKKGVILGLLMFCFFYLLLEGQRMTNTSKTAFLTGTYVLFVPFIDWIYVKVRPGIYSFFAAAFSVAGIGLMSPGGFQGLERGDIYLLAGAFFVAVHMVFSAGFVQDEKPLHLNMVQLSVTAILSLLAFVLFEGGGVPMTPRSWLAVGYIGVFSTFFAYMLQTTGQKSTTASRASVLLSLEAPVGTFFGVLFYGDLINFRMSMGYLLIFLAVLVSEGILFRFFEKRRSPGDFPGDFFP